MKTRLLVITLLVQGTVVGGISQRYTQECIAKARNQNCNVFNICCQFRCGTASSRISTCIAEKGFIQAHQSECRCSDTEQANFRHQPERTSKISRIDVVAGVLLLFVTDMLILSFTF